MGAADGSSAGSGTMIRAILFDFEHTLVDVAVPLDAGKLFHAGASGCYAFLSAHEVPLPAFDTFHRQQKWIHRKSRWATWLSGGEPDMRRVLRRICQDYGLQRDQSSLAKLAWPWYEPRTEHMRVAADAIATLTTLVDCGLELGLVINTPWQGAVIDQHLEELGLLEFFPTRAYSTEMGARKPDPRLFQSALDAFNVQPAETIYVGTNVDKDLLGAQRMGMSTVMCRANESDGGMPWADHAIDKLSQLPQLPPLAHLKPRTRPAPLPMPAFTVATRR